jgi:hypothetical protein
MRSMSASRASHLTGVGSLSLLVFTMILLLVASVGRADETVQVCGSYARLSGLAVSSAAFKTMPSWVRTSSPVIVGRCCCCRRR